MPRRRRDHDHAANQHELAERNVGEAGKDIHSR